MTTTSKPQSYKPFTDESESRTTVGLPFGKMNPFQQLLAVLMESFIRDEPDDEVNDQQDTSLAQMLGFDDKQDVKKLRQELRESKNDPKAKNPQDTFDFSKVNWSNTSDFVTKRVLPPIGAGLATGNANFDVAVRKVLKIEGGLNLHEPDGAIANFGFNSKANPGLDVRKLDVNSATALYKDRYWNTVNGIDKMTQAQALVAFDCSVNCGVGTANKMMRELTAKHGGDLSKVNVQEELDWRANFYSKITANNPERNSKYLTSWNNRLDGLSRDIGRMDNVPPTPDFKVATTKSPAVISTPEVSLMDKIANRLEKAAASVLTPT